MLDRLELEDMLAFARATVEAAGPIALKYFRMPITVENKAGSSVFDPVTRADREVEAFIRDRVSSAYPGHIIIGEETGTSGGEESFKWLIDPIDGTRAYISGVPMWGILLGLMDGDSCLFGLMHQPYLRETYSGSIHGAFISKGETTQPLATRGTSELADAILYCTHPDVFSTDEDFTRFRAIADQSRLMRYGGDCYSYCLLAQGCIDLVIEADLNAYDIVPLIPIIEAAGGRVTDWQGNSAVNGGKVIASANSVLHEKVLQLI